MRKAITTDSYEHEDGPSVSIMPICRSGRLEKTAGKKNQTFADIQVTPDPKLAYLQIIAMGDSEVYGANKNADGFKRATLLTAHPTFVKHAKVYEEHDARPELATGSVPFSAHNDDMSRVELVIAVDSNKWANDLHKIASGDPITFSMGCSVPYDECVICGNQAPTRKQYCECMRKHANQVLDDGRRVYVDNPNPKFFDISKVRNPADLTAYCLRKVASSFLLGVDLADALYGDSDDSSVLLSSTRTQRRFDKLSAAAKLAEIEKQIELRAHANPTYAASLKVVPHKLTAEAALKTLAKHANRLPELMRGLADRNISLPFPAFVTLMTGSSVPDSAMPQVKMALCTLFRDINKTASEVVDSGDYDPAARCTIREPEAFAALEDAYGLGREATARRQPILNVKSGADLQLPVGKCMLICDSGELDADIRKLAFEYGKYKLATLTTVQDPAIRTLSVAQDFL